MTWKRVRALIAIAGVGAAFAVVGIAVAPHSRSNVLPGPSGTIGSCVDLARDVDPKKAPVDSGYDPEQDLVTATFAGRTYVMRSNDPVCMALAGPRAIVEDALNASREDMVIVCRQVSAALADGRTNYRGRRFHADAGRRFMERRCGGGRP